jgi:hypothetical protein
LLAFFLWSVVMKLSILLFKVLTMALLKTQVFWDVMPCWLVNGYWLCRGN